MSWTIIRDGMTLSVVVAFLGAGLSGAVALAVALRAKRSLIRWSFVAGMALLAGESALSGLILHARDADDMLYWQHWRLYSISLAPGICLFFGVCYARANVGHFLARWRIPLVVAFLLPPPASPFCSRIS